MPELGRRYRLSHGFIHRDGNSTVTQRLEIFQVIVPSIFPDAFEELCLGNRTLQFMVCFFF